MEHILAVGIWALISAPIWLPVLGCWLPMGVARRLRRWLGRIALGTSIFAMLHAKDGDPIQFEAAMISMPCIWLYISGALLTGVVAMREKARLRHTEAEPAGTVLTAEDRTTPLPAAQPSEVQQRRRRLLWDLIVIAVVICLLTPLSWQGQARRQVARRTVCRLNLNRCGKALGVYAGKNGGSFPADIDTLVQQGLTESRDFICPASRPAPARDYEGPLGAYPANQLIPPQLHEILHSCYVYIPHQHAPADPTDVLMYEKNGCHPKDGGNVLFGDYHAEWIEPYSKVEELVAKTEQRLATPTSSPVAAPG